MNNEKLLEVKDLRISFSLKEGIVKAIRGVSFDLYKGETLCIVGESGSGKSVTSKAIVGILDNNKIVEDGSIIFHDKDLLISKDRELDKIRGRKISMIFQDTMSTLNPIIEVGKQVEEAIKKRNSRNKAEFRKEISYFKEKFDKEFLENVKDLTQKFIKKEIDENTYNIEKEKLTLYYKDKYSEILKNEVEVYNLKLYDLTLEVENLNNLINENNYDEFIKCFKKFKNNYKNFIFGLNEDKDYFVQNFIVTTSHFIYLYKKSFKEEVQRVKLFTKNNVLSYDYYDLPPKVKAKSKEVILLTKDIEEKIKNSIKEFSEIITKKQLNFNESSDFLNYLFKIYLSYYQKESKEEIKSECIKLLNEVGLEESIYKKYPFELSGGMRQRIVIAISLSSNPEILICDEPTTSLDVIIQNQILNLIEKLKKERNLSIIFITHDFGVVSKIADRVLVMYGGKIVEEGTLYDIFYDPRHPYTWVLLGSLPDKDAENKLLSIKGSVPNMLIPLKGDLFSYRSEYAIKQDRLEEPPMFEVSKTHKAATWLLHEFSEEVTPPQILIDRIKEDVKDEVNIPSYTNKKNSILEIIKKGEQK